MASEFRVREETAKALRAAGFPQEGTHWWYRFRGEKVSHIDPSPAQRANVVAYAVSAWDLVVAIPDDILISYVVQKESQYIFQIAKTIEILRSPEKLAEAWLWWKRRENGFVAKDPGRTRPAGPALLPGKVRQPVREKKGNSKTCVSAGKGKGERR
jgi:hypothetical protein